MKKRLGPVERLYPMPAVVVLGGTVDGADALAVAWINVVASTPPTIAMGLRRTRRTLELIRANGAFSVNVPDSSLVASLDYCGIVSGHSAADKISRAGFTLVPGTSTDTALISECPYNLECRVTNEVEVGEYVVVFGEILEAHAEQRILRDGTDIVEMDALDPIVYIPGAREYRTLGPKLADAYTVGKSLAQDGHDA